MNLTNDIKRIRKLLKVFDVEGSQEVMEKLIVIMKYGNKNDIAPASIVRMLKISYAVTLAKLLEKRQKYNQGKIKFDDDKTKKS